VYRIISRWEISKGETFHLLPNMCYGGLIFKSKLNYKRFPHFPCQDCQVIHVTYSDFSRLGFGRFECFWECTKEQVHIVTCDLPSKYYTVSNKFIRTDSKELFILSITYYVWIYIQRTRWKARYHDHVGVNLALYA